MKLSEKQAKMDALCGRRDELETQLDAIGKVERLMESRGYTWDEMAAVHNLDERIVDEWAQVACEINELDHEWVDEDSNIELY